MAWTGKDPDQAAKAGVPLSLPLMERARSARRDPHHEPELSLCVAFAALAKARPPRLDWEVADNFARWVAEKLARRSDGDHTCPSCEQERWAALGSLNASHAAAACRRDVMRL